MGVVRIVADLPVADVTRANEMYARVFDLEVNMDLGWVGNLGPADAPAVQLQTLTQDAAAPCNPAISVGVAAPTEVDEIYQRVAAAGLEIVHPPTDEQWGVRRFFFRDPDGNVVNVVANRPG
jgi:catechol 2,3-dioxygenase-like lactoylglutathione lyase family enzyme